MIQPPRIASALFAFLLSILALSPLEARAADDIMIADFEASDYGDWKTEGNAFGSGPAQGRLDRQGTPTRYEGKRLANSYHGYEQGTGRLTSPPFKIERKYVNFLIGGGGFPVERASTFCSTGNRYEGRPPSIGGIASATSSTTKFCSGTNGTSAT
jgi:hypothetical protein